MNEKHITADNNLSDKISSLESAMLGQRQLIIEQQKMIEEQENLIKEQDRVINDINNETDDGDEQTVWTIFCVWKFYFYSKVIRVDLLVYSVDLK